MALRSDTWRRAVEAALMIAVLAAPAAEAKKPRLLQVAEAVESQQSFSMPATGTIEVAFSPNEGA